MDTYFDVSKLRIKLIWTGIAGVKNIGCNFRNTYVGFSWASSSEMIKFSSHETQQIAVESRDKDVGSACPMSPTFSVINLQPGSLC